MKEIKIYPFRRQVSSITQWTRCEIVRKCGVLFFSLSLSAVIRPSDVIDPTLPKRKITILGDTYSAKNIAPLALESDLVIHEVVQEIFYFFLNSHSNPVHTPTPFRKGIKIERSLHCAKCRQFRRVCLRAKFITQSHLWSWHPSCMCSLSLSLLLWRFFTSGPLFFFTLCTTPSPSAPAACHYGLWQSLCGHRPLSSLFSPSIQWVRKKCVFLTIFILLKVSSKGKDRYYRLAS